MLAAPAVPAAAPAAAPEASGELVVEDGVCELWSAVGGGVVLLGEALWSVLDGAVVELGFACCEFCDPSGCEYDGLLVVEDPEVPVVLLGVAFWSVVLGVVVEVGVVVDDGEVVEFC